MIKIRSQTILGCIGLLLGACSDQYSSTRTPIQDPQIESLAKVLEAIQGSNPLCAKNASLQFEQHFVENAFPAQIKPAHEIKLLQVLTTQNFSQLDTLYRARRSAVSRLSSKLNSKTPSIQTTHDILRIANLIFINCALYENFQARTLLLDWSKKAPASQGRKVHEAVLESFRLHSEEDLSGLSLILNLMLAKQLVENSNINFKTKTIRAIDTLADEIKGELERLAAKVKHNSPDFKLIFEPSKTKEAVTARYVQNLIGAMHLEFSMLPIWKKRFATILKNLRS